MRRNRLVLVAGVLACVALGFLFHTSRQRGASMREQLATLRQTSQAAPAPIPPGAVAAETKTAAAMAEQRELTEWAALLEAARRVPDVARREAALRVIKRIRAAHAANPPPPRPVPPPAPRDAMYFAELLDDPEYLQLVAQRWRSAQGLHIEQRLARLSLPEAVRNKIVELEFDSYTARLEVQRYVRADAAERDAALAASQKLRAENDAAIQQLLGEEAHAAYRESAPANTVPTRIPDSVLEPLAMRLSYSASPLEPATRAQLVELLQSMSASTSAFHSLPRTPEFIDRARSILQPAQVAALEELRAEYEAARARSRLPKSSELPRTTRRQRLEPGSH